MLIRFVISNFLSFNSETEFNMLAGSFRTHKNHLYKAKTLNILKGAAIYGANGAGKSNFIKAIDFFQDLIDEGELSRTIDTKKFKLNTHNFKKPSEFEIEFYYKRKIYSYGLRINGNTIEQEWLYLSGIEKYDKVIFERQTNKTGKSTIKLSKKYLKTQKDKLLIELMEDNLLKSNELLLSKDEELKITDISNTRKWISEQLVIVYPHSKFNTLVPAIAASDKFKQFANQLLKTFNTGVNELGVENIEFDKYFGREYDEIKKDLLEDIDGGHSILFPTQYETVIITKEKDRNIVKKVFALHSNNDGNKIKFNLSEESDGTLRLLNFLPALEKILNSDTTFIIDEIDQSLHPALLFDLVTKIMRVETTQGQLIFTTHESNLLDLNIFRQDEIWFAEKNEQGCTRLYSLSDYKPRYDLDIRKGYLKGRFGAIPFTADLKKLKWKDNDA